MALNTPMKIVLAVVFIFLIGIGFYLLDYQKKLTDLKQLEMTLESKKNELKTNEERVKDLPEQLAKKEKLETELKQLIKDRLPDEDESVFVASFIYEIEKLVAEESSLLKDGDFRLLSIVPMKKESPSAADKGGKKKTSKKGAGADGSSEDGPKIKALQVLPTQKFNISMRGRYNTLIHFLHQLAALRLKRLVTINKISLSPQGKAEIGVSPVLSIQLPVTAYLNTNQGGAGDDTEDSGGKKEK